MNSINAASVSSLVPQASLPTAPISGLTPPTGDPEVLPAIGAVDQVDLTFEIDPATPHARVQPVVNPTAWSPGMWWLLNRYEYLFVGLLPDQGEQIIVIDEGHDQSASISSLGQPHWGESNLINPPPAAATLQVSNEEELPSQYPAVSPQPAGTFVDVVA